MSHDAYDQVLRLARELPPEQQQALAQELTIAVENAANSAAISKTVGEALRESGFVGSLKDVPPDYATNPKHMEGFGEHAG